MEVEIRDDVAGNPVYLYHREFKLTEIKIERLMSKYLGLLPTLFIGYFLLIPISLISALYAVSTLILLIVYTLIKWK